MAKKGRVALRLRRYKPVMVRAGDVTIEALELVEERIIEEKGPTPLDALINAVEKLSKNEPDSIFEVEASDGTRHIIGELPRAEGRVLLYPRPARLMAVGLIRVRDALSKGESSGAALIRFPGGSIEMRRVRRKVYVYEGRVEAPEDAYLLVLDTELGRRYVRLAGEPIIESLVRHVLTPPGRDGESPSSGPGGGGDSSPSG